MTTDREQYLLERCLRLEADLLLARGMDIAPPLPYVARRGVYAAPLPSYTLAPPPHRIYRAATADEIAQMRRLRARGLGYAAIARTVPFCATTVRDHTYDVLVEKTGTADTGAMNADMKMQESHRRVSAAPIGGSAERQKAAA